MKIIKYPQIPPKKFDSEEMKGITGRVVIGKNEGAKNFCMRLFEVEPGGNSPKHIHDWEHEIFIHSGNGEVYSNGSWHTVSTNDAIFIPASEEHQIRNKAQEKLVFLCLIPAKAPEI